MHIINCTLSILDGLHTFDSVSNHNICLALQNDLHSMESPNFNESKCAVVRFSPRSTASPPNQLYLINCHTVTRLKCHKDLGIYTIIA